MSSFFAPGDRVTFARPTGDGQTVHTRECDTGEVERVESAEAVHVRWDDGSSETLTDSDIDLV